MHCGGAAGEGRRLGVQHLIKAVARSRAVHFRCARGRCAFPREGGKRDRSSPAPGN